MSAWTKYVSGRTAPDICSVTGETSTSPPGMSSSERILGNQLSPVDGRVLPSASTPPTRTGCPGDADEHSLSGVNGLRQCIAILKHTFCGAVLRMPTKNFFGSPFLTSISVPSLMTNSSPLSSRFFLSWSLIFASSPARSSVPPVKRDLMKNIARPKKVIDMMRTTMAVIGSSSPFLLCMHTSFCVLLWKGLYKTFFNFRVRFAYSGSSRKILNTSYSLKIEKRGCVVVR